MLLEHCCIHKLIQSFIRKECTVPMYHIGEVQAHQYIEWLGNASDPGSTMYIILPDMYDSTIYSISKSMCKRSPGKEASSENFNIQRCIVITNHVTASLIELYNTYHGRIEIYESSNIHSNLIASSSVSLIGEFQQLVEYGPVVFMGNINQNVRIGISQLTMSTGNSFWEKLSSDITSCIELCRKYKP